MALLQCVVSRFASAWAESFDGVMSGHQSSTLLCRCRCRLLLAEIPKGVDRNSELKQRIHLWETGQISDLICKVLGQQNSGPLRRTARRVQSQTDEQRGKRACALVARGSISKATKGLVGGAAPCTRQQHPILVPSFLQAKVGAERNPRKKKSSTAWETLTLLLLSGKSVTFRTWPPQLPLEASHSESLSDLDRYITVGNAYGVLTE